MTRRNKRLAIGFGLLVCVVLLSFAWRHDLFSRLSQDLKSASGASWDDQIFVAVATMALVLFLFWTNFRLVEILILRKHRLYRDIWASQNPQIAGIIFVLRTRARRAMRQGRIALFGTVGLILLVIGFLISTIQVSEQRIADNSKLVTAKRDLGRIQAIMNEVNGLIKIDKPLNLISGKYQTLSLPEDDLSDLGFAPLKYMVPTEEEIEGARKKDSDFRAAQRINDKDSMSVGYSSVENRNLKELIDSYNISNDALLKRYYLKLESKEKRIISDISIEDSKIKNSSKIENKLDFSTGQAIFTRFASVLVVLFLTQILVGLYRYSMRLSAFYDSRADMLELADADIDLSHLDKVSEVISPERYDFGKTPRSPAESAVDLAKELVRIRKA
jgi:hypothetical protein